MYEYHQLKESSMDMDVYNDNMETDEDENAHDLSMPYEKVPLGDEEDNFVSRTGRCQQFLNDDTFRTKFFHTCFLYLAFGIQGWIKGQFGPAFLDLQIITHSGQEECSWLMTMLFVGHMFASPVGGVLYKKANSLLTMGIAHIGVALAVCSIPWCSLFSLMMTAYLVLGMFFGIIDTIGNTEIFYVWEGKGKIHMQGVQLAFAFAGVISPFLTAPFLLPPSSDSHVYGPVNDTTFVTDGYIQLTMTKENLISYTTDTGSTGTPHYPTIQQSSRLYIAFSITGALGFIVAVGFFTLFVKTRTQPYMSEKPLYNQDSQRKRTFSKFTKYRAILGLSLILLLSSGIDFGYNTYLVSFLVKQVNWTKSMGSTLSSLVFLLDVVGRVSGLFLIRIILPESLTVFHCAVSVVVVGGLLISIIFSANVGVWIFGSLFGYARSIIFPTVFIWANERLFPATGQISAVFIIAAAVGVTTNPVIMGYIMESFSDMWFCYVLLGESVLLLGVCIIILMMTKFIVKREGTLHALPS